ncbi:hypothetical protein HPB47_004834, partial [Ixodes persulcatus]
MEFICQVLSYPTKSAVSVGAGLGNLPERMDGWIDVSGYTLPNVPRLARLGSAHFALGSQTGVLSSWADAAWLDSALGTPVTLRVDKNGFFLFWTDQNKETEFLDISSIRDTRTGKYARTPKEGKLRDSVSMGASDTPLEEKTLTVVYGPDLVNVSVINFCCNSRETAQLWTDELLRMAYNLLSLNAPASRFLEKAHTKLLLTTDREGRLPVKGVLRMFAQHRDDRRRVERALDAVGLAAGKNDTLAPDRLCFDVFLRFYRQLVGRQEVDAIFERLCGGAKKKAMTVDQLVDFLNKEQRDPRLNEILYPYANPARAKDIIAQYEPNKSYVAKGLFSVEGFLRYLMSADNPIVSPEKFDLSLDMDQPLNHYFINSSHNTYLTGHQLTGKSSVEMYRQCLLAGCRCIELDCWTGRNSDEEPIITHGYTVVTEVLLREVIEAIAESAFKTSDFPVVLSFENHCSPKQQAKMANYCRKLFGDMLVTEPMLSHPLRPGQPLPSPQQLLRKIIIKNKKKHHARPHKPLASPSVAAAAAAAAAVAPGGGAEDDASPGEGPDDLNGDAKGSEADDWDTDSGTEEEEVPERSGRGPERGHGCQGVRGCGRDVRARQLHPAGAVPLLRTRRETRSQLRDFIVRRDSSHQFAQGTPCRICQ